VLNRRELVALMYAVQRNSACAAVPADVLAMAESWGVQMSGAANRGEASITLDVTDEAATREGQERIEAAFRLMGDYSPELVKDFNGRWKLTLVWAGTSVRVREGKV
jgi:hypothetical protein